jgi:hypothetical protein
MRFPSLLLITLAAAAASVAAQAQPQSTPDAAPSPLRSAPKADDCATGALKRHDHTADRGYGPMAAKPCRPAIAAAEAAASAAKVKKGHDHGKFHKNQ